MSSPLYQGHIDSIELKWQGEFVKWLQQFYTLGHVPAHDSQLQEQRGRGGHCVWSWQLCAPDSVRKQCANEQGIYLPYIFKIIST